MFGDYFDAFGFLLWCLGVVVICFGVGFVDFWGLVYWLLILVLVVASGCCCFCGGMIDFVITWCLVVL